MAALKKRYDEDFIVARPARGSTKREVVRLAGEGPVEDIDATSPARTLQAELDARINGSLGETAVVHEEKFSGPATLAIIVGSSLGLWGLIAAAGLLIF